MKRLFTTLYSFLFIFTLCSCSNVGQPLVPIRTDISYLDIQEAKKIIEPGNKLIADISIKESVTRQQFEQFLSDIKTTYRDDIPWAYMFFYNTEFEDKSVNVLHLNKNMFYPTIYHEDIELTSAKVEDIHYEFKALDMTMLKIKIEYIGGDSRLKGWFREYIYRKTDNNTWAFDALGGQDNFLGVDFKPDYLKLK